MRRLRVLIAIQERVDAIAARLSILIKIYPSVFPCEIISRLDIARLINLPSPNCTVSSYSALQNTPIFHINMKGAGNGDEFEHTGGHSRRNWACSEKPKANELRYDGAV
jgi:hypothetical protein